MADPEPGLDIREVLKDPLAVKEHPELRHVLAHLYYAIESLCLGDRVAAAYEIKSVEGLIFWDSADHQRRYMEGKSDDDSPASEEDPRPDAPGPEL